MPTLLDIAIMNGADAEVGLIEEAFQGHPEISGFDIRTGTQIANVGDGRTIRGTQYKTLVRTGVPTVGFRHANQGVAAGKSTYENRLVETFILNPRAECDKAVAMAHEDGWQAFMAIEAAGQLEGAFQTAGRQFYYGKGTGDAKGHPGLIDVYDAANMVVDAAGTTAGTGSSVWLVKWGPQHVRWVFGRDGQFEMDDVREESIDDEEGNRYTALIQELTMWMGVQVGSRHSAVRIKNLTEDAGKGLTDDLVYDALEKFPSGVVPDVIFMNRRSLGQLRKSRTATNATGTPAPLPTEVDGVPIMVTDSILNTEPLTL